jgi:inosose dehydratase
VTHAINRRTFLQSQASFVAGAAIVGSARRAAAAEPTIALGFSLYGMRSLELDAAVAACAEIGYTAVELAVMAGWPADSATLSKDARRRLRDRIGSLGLALPALMENLPLDVDEPTHQRQLDRIKSAAELAHDVAIGSPPIIETILGGKPGEWDSIKAQFAQRLGDWLKIAAAADATIAVKPHRLGAMNTPADAVSLVSQLGSGRLTLVYDFSHFEHRGMSIADTLRTMLPHTRFVHVKDSRVDGNRVQFLLPGAGATDYAALFTHLREMGYRGSVCVEVSGQIHNRKDYDPLRAARFCYEKLSPAYRN